LSPPNDQQNETDVEVESAAHPQEKRQATEIATSPSGRVELVNAPVLTNERPTVRVVKNRRPM